MRKIITIPVNQVTPTIESILEGQGIPPRSKPEVRTIELAEEAISIYRKKAIPAGILFEISKEEFDSVFAGGNMNDGDSPVEPIYKSSDDLALFAVTIDQPVCSEISGLFQKNEFALGSMLDSTASAGTEMTAQAVEDFYRQHLIKIARFNYDIGILRFSPGYCGWHISAQRSLFHALRPEDIDITLNDSFLMQPLKSISGLIVAGRKEIFAFEDTFGFCADCATHNCRERIKTMFEQ